MTRIFIGVLASVLSCSSIAQACSADELLAKMLAASAKAEDIARKDPHRGAPVRQRLVVLQQISAQPKSVNEMCRTYDELIASLD
jgi:hypothetical protein